MAVIFIGFADELISLFFFFNEHVEQLAVYRQSLVAMLPWILLIILFHSFLWTFAGVLVAAGDTKFIMYINAANAWIFGVIPIYFYLYHFNGSAQAIWQLACVYSFLGMLFIYLRYRNGRWKTIHLVSD